MALTPVAGRPVARSAVVRGLEKLDAKIDAVAGTVPGIVDAYLEGNPPQGTDAPRPVELGFSYPGAVPAEIGEFPITTPLTIKPLLCLAQATGTGTVTFSMDGEEIGAVFFPSASFSIYETSLPRGFLTFTATGSLSDLSVAIAGER